MTRRGEDRLDLFHERKFDANLVVRFNFYFRSRGRRKKKKMKGGMFKIRGVTLDDVSLSLSLFIFFLLIEILLQHLKLKLNLNWNINRWNCRTETRNSVNPLLDQLSFFTELRGLCGPMQNFFLFFLIMKNQ